MPKIKHVSPLTAEQLVLCPYGEPKCRLCRLTPDQLKDVHKQKITNGYSYAQIRKYIKEHLKMGVDYSDISHHFNRHVLGKHILQKVLGRRADNAHPAIIKALDTISTDSKVVTSEELEKAYNALVKMAQGFTSKANRLQERIEVKFNQRDQDKTLDAELDAHSIMDLMEKQAKLNKEAREFVKEVSALRAPKVMVAQFLEAFIDDVIKELSYILSNMCGEMQFDISNELDDSGHPGILGSETFAKIYRKTGLDYRDRMINLKRQKMADAMSALQDLEKLI